MYVIQAPVVNDIKFNWKSTTILEAFGMKICC